MILTDRVAQGVAAGHITEVYRRWARPRIRAGTTMHTTAGLVEIVAVDEIDSDAINDDDAQRAGEQTAADVRAAFRGSDSHPAFRIRLRYLGPDDRTALSTQADLDAAEVAEVAAALARLDRANPHGPWTHEVLSAVAAHPGRRAADLAAILGRDKERLKLDIRKLKNRGLTVSLNTGYEISPRGRAYLLATGASGRPRWTRTR